MRITDKNVLVVGGTGTLGQALIRRISGEARSITVLSRDEHKQAAMRPLFGSLVKYKLGDIREDNLNLSQFDVVFHVAALKHVDILEDNPAEGYRTNVVGTLNLAHAAMRDYVPYFVFSSTDKAVDPINAYGYSKAMAEKALYHLNADQDRTLFSVFRWGNVLGSNGSAIHGWVRALLKNEPVMFTDRRMTRFWITIEQAVDYMLETFATGQLTQSAYVPPGIRAAPIVQVVDIIADILKIKNYESVEIGFRPGEKMHEAMFSQHSPLHLTSETAEQYTKKELELLLRPLVEKCARAVREGKT